MKQRITISLVAYNTSEELVAATIKSAESQLVKEFNLLDNSNDSRYQALAKNLNLRYEKSNTNLGFGRGHNQIIKKRLEQSDYFLILNPDVELHENCLANMVAFMDAYPHVPLCAPKILNPDGTIQRVHKRLPTFKIQFFRRFMPRIFKKLWEEDLRDYELQDCDLTQRLVIPSVSGCCMFFRSKALELLGGFDERYFMYQEDIDISREAFRLGPSVYLPEAVATHHWARGSHKNLKLTFLNIVSVFKYYAKWGFRRDIEPRVFIGD